MKTKTSAATPLLPMTNREKSTDDDSLESEDCALFPCALNNTAESEPRFETEGQAHEPSQKTRQLAAESRLRLALIRWCQSEPREFVAVIALLQDERDRFEGDAQWPRLIELACEYLPLAKLAGRNGKKSL